MYEPLPWSEYRADPSDSSEEKASGRMRWKQSGCCGEAQADGVPCDDVECSCETCQRSRLEKPSASRSPR